MSIGIGIFLLVLGAILAFAVNADLGWLDVNVVGWILILAGAAELVITLGVWSRRRRSTAVTQREVLQDGQPTTVTERRTVSDASVPPDTGPGGSIRAPSPGRRP
ncbi:MAG TPA: DUF6458 family protein [Actinocatenispora sp.]